MAARFRATPRDGFLALVGSDKKMLSSPKLTLQSPLPAARRSCSWRPCIGIVGSSWCSCLVRELACVAVAPCPPQGAARAQYFFPKDNNQTRPAKQHSRAAGRHARTKGGSPACAAACCFALWFSTADWTSITKIPNDPEKPMNSISEIQP